MKRIAWGLTFLAALVLVDCSRGGGGNRMIQNKGSDTMVNLAQAWAEEYRKVDPVVAVAVTGGGSGTGIAALINGTVDIANASRDIKPDEREAARKNNAQDVVEHVVAYDALAVYVHAQNPLPRISRSQLACVYGEKGTCTKWTDLGVEVPGCAGQEIVRTGRQNNSGTYAYFREWVLGEAQDFKLGSRDMQGSKDVVELVANTPCAIGYSGIGYKTAQVRGLCLAAGDQDPCTEPSTATTMDSKYPLSRALYMYTRGNPQGEVAKYLAWIRSDAGQAVVVRAGYAPLPKGQPLPAAQQ